MTEKRKTANPAVADGDGAVASAASSSKSKTGEETGNETGKETGKWPWLPTVFLVLTVAGVGAGFWFKQLAVPGQESAALLAAPQRVGVYANQQGVMVDLTAGITWQASRPAVAGETLYAAVAGPGVTPATTLLFTSTIAPTPGSQPYRRTTFYVGGDLQRTQPEWVLTISVAKLESSRGQYGSAVGTFTLPEIVQLSGGSTFAHLPALAPNVSPFPSMAIEMAESSSSTGSIQDVVDAPVLRSLGLAASSTANYIGAAPATSARELYYDPQNLMTTESIDGLRTDLENSVVNSDLPGNGTLEGDDYVWQGTGWLEGYLSATELSAGESQANWDFSSGLVFGLAAAAGIAFLQEPVLPWRRRDKRSPDPDPVTASAKGKEP
jgi:hypothetical protein